MQGIEELAHAKVNLFLRVLRRREDGFHEIETLMAPIALYDFIEIEPANSFQFHCDKRELACDERVTTADPRSEAITTPPGPRLVVVVGDEVRPSAPSGWSGGLFRQALPADRLPPRLGPGRPPA